MEHRVWKRITAEAEKTIGEEPVLSSFLTMTVLDHDNLYDGIINYLSEKMEHRFLSRSEIHRVFKEGVGRSPEIRKAVVEDLIAFKERDPASRGLMNPFLNYKGYHALESYRIAHWLWSNRRYELAFLLQSMISRTYGVDIHPAAKIGIRVFIDHATGLVIGETAVVGDDVSLLHGVTLGGTGNHTGDRHPKVGHGVLIGAGSKILGNIRIGEGAKVGAGSVVLKDVPPHTTVVGIPAKIVGRPSEDLPSLGMDQMIGDYEI